MSCSEVRMQSQSTTSQGVGSQANTPSHGGNPKDAIGASKAPLSTLDPQVVHEMALGMFEGECKYWRHNYIAARVRAMVYSDAHDRHMSAWKAGQDIDPDSGLSHLVKAMACLHIIRAAEIHGSLIDDRPPANPDPEWMRKLDAKALEITRRLAEFERGAFTEANRAEWPAMCERLANGPIRKAPPRTHAESGPVGVRIGHTAHAIVCTSEPRTTAFDPSVAPPIGAPCEVRITRDRNMWERAVYTGPGPYGHDTLAFKRERGGEVWYLHKDPTQYSCAEWRLAPTAADERARRDHIGA